MLELGLQTTVDDVHIEVVEHFKHVGSLKSAGNCNNHTKSQFGIAKKRMLDIGTDLERKRNNKQRAENGTMI